MPETIGESLSLLWPLFLVAGVLLLFLTISKAKKVASYKKILIAGLIMLGVSLGSGIVLGTGEAGGMQTLLTAIFVGVPGLFLTATALVLMLGQSIVSRRKH